MVRLWLHLAIIQFGRELLSSHQIIENPKKQVDKHGVKHAEPQNFQCLIDRRIASRISMNTTSGCLAFKSSCFCLGCPKATRFLCIAIWSCCFFCRVLYREHWVKLQLIWEVPQFTNWLAMEKWKTKRYDTTQPRLHVIWIMALLIMFFLTCLNLSSRLKIGKLFVHALFLFVVFSCLLPFCRYGPIYRFFHFTILPQPKEPRPWTYERPFSRITPSPGLWST